MLIVNVLGAEDESERVQTMAQEVASKPVLPVEKMLSKKACLLLDCTPVLKSRIFLIASHSALEPLWPQVVLCALV
jgi:hypothetical protein